MDKGAVIIDNRRVELEHFVCRFSRAVRTTRGDNDVICFREFFQITDAFMVVVVEIGDERAVQINGDQKIFVHD